MIVMKKTVQYFVLGLCPSSQISLSVLFITHALTKAVPKQGFILPKGIFGVVEERICTLVTISHRRIFFIFIYSFSVNYYVLYALQIAPPDILSL